MRVITLKFKIIIGVTLFILLLGAYYSASIFNGKNKNVNQEVQIGEIIYKGKFLMPVENFIVVTSKFGGRVHPITRKAKFSHGY